MKPPKDSTAEDRAELRAEKLRHKRNRIVDTPSTRAIARGQKIRPNFSDTPKGEKRTKPPRNSIWPEAKSRPSL